MEKSKLPIIGGVITAIIASLCCIGPVVVALIGVGSIGAFSVFEAYRPYLIGLTAAILGLAFYLTYRKREVKCEDSTCPEGMDSHKVESAGKWNKIAVWLVTFIAAVAIAFPYFGVAPSSPMNAAVQGKAIATLSIEGMTCEACAKGIERSLVSIKGVRKANVEYKQGRAVVEYNPEIAQPKAFVERINESGFTAKIFEQQKGE
jgi:copper chaperone CopZ